MQLNINKPNILNSYLIRHRITFLTKFEYQIILNNEKYVDMITSGNLYNMIEPNNNNIINNRQQSFINNAIATTFGANVFKSTPPLINCLSPNKSSIQFLQQTLQMHTQDTFVLNLQPNHLPSFRDKEKYKTECCKCN